MEKKLMKFETDAFMNCPWCGTNEHMEVGYEEPGLYYAVCRKCGCHGPVSDYSEMTAVKDWNTRTLR